MKDILFELDNIFKGVLMKDVEFSLNNKTFKSGKVYLFEHGYFNFVFFIRTKKKDTTLKLPIPFDYRLKPNLIEFDYRVETFINNQPHLMAIINKLPIPNPSKYYNNILKIKVLT